MIRSIVDYQIKIIKLLQLIIMAWLMFKESGSHQNKGKKCDGFANKVKPQIDLSWGMDNIESFKKQEFIKSNANPSNIYQKNNRPKIMAGVYDKKSDQEELQKIMKKYELKKIGLKVLNINDHEINQRSDTEQSSQRIRNLETSLLPVSQFSSFQRRDTMGYLINQQRIKDSNMSQSKSRVSRRSTSGNKKNESKIIFGDGAYSEFVPQTDKKKDFHQQLMEMYDYEQKRNSRNVSQVFK